MTGGKLFKYSLVCALGRISWFGLRMERPLSVDARGKRQESSGGGRVSRSLWKRVMLAISLCQDNGGQLSCLNKSVLGVQKEREEWSEQRLPGHAQWPWHLAQEDCHARQETHTPVLDVESMYCKSRIFRMHSIFVYFVRGGFRTKIQCIRKVVR